MFHNYVGYHFAIYRGGGGWYVHVDRERVGLFTSLVLCCVYRNDDWKPAVACYCMQAYSLIYDSVVVCLLISYSIMIHKCILPYQHFM